MLNRSKEVLNRSKEFLIRSKEFLNRSKEFFNRSKEFLNPPIVRHNLEAIFSKPTKHIAGIELVVSFI
jgi:hypothetical protein